MALQITEENYNEVLSSDKPILLDFWAEWCGPCKLIGPIIDEVSEEFSKTAIVGKVNVDEAGALSSKYGIRNIPTLLYIKNGEVVDKHVGATSKKEISDKLSALL
jgi:thioredoxin 1